MNLTILTNSELSTFRTCPRKHYLAYRTLIRPQREGTALTLGSIFHKALELWMTGTLMEDACKQSIGNGNISHEVGMIAAMLHGYAARWHDDATDPTIQVREVLAVEKQFEIALPRSKGVRIAGKIDAIVRLGDGQLAVMEHKTTSESIEPGSDYWARLLIDSQISTYVLGAKSLGFNVTTILYDVAKKPGIKPLKATPIESRKFTKEGNLYAAQRLEDESVEDYIWRCCDSVNASPNDYYARRQVPRLDSDISAYVVELQQQIRVLRASKRDKDVPYRNSGSCDMYGRCQYFDLCVRNDTGQAGVPDGFKVVAKKHGELV